MRLNKILSIGSIVFIVLLLIVQSSAFAANTLPKGKEGQIEEYIKKNMGDSKIPGLSVVIVDGNETIYEKGFGFSDVAAKKPVTPDTLFELGSTSKAFTALAVLQLEEKGLLNLDDPVSKYIPWFDVNYKGQKVDIKLSQLLYHTSGMPFKTIGDIPIDDSKDALEKTVRTFVGESLDFMPGEKYLYATINYDILGLVIQKVSGQSYEEYIKSNVLNQLGLSNTYLRRQEAPAQNMSIGYKFDFLRPVRYDAPMYRGNTPAGYFITNIEDMAKWMKIQLGVDNGIAFDKQLIEKSHLPDRSVSPDVDGSSYAAGWSIYQNGSGEISHPGNNPNFSSFIVFRPQDKKGVAVLANLDSSYTLAIGQGIMDIIQGKKLVKPEDDMYKGVDNLASAIVFITVPVILLILWFMAKYIIETLRRKRTFKGNIIKSIIGSIIFIIFMAGFTYCLYKIPDVLYQGLNWSFVKVWAPQSLILAVISLFVAVLLFNLYFMFTALFPQNDDKSLFILIILSIASGFGNALIIFTVNETLNRDNGFQGGLLLYFIIAMAIYVFGQRLVRTRLINITNGMVYQKRMELIDKILGTSYQGVEGIEYGRIQASLNNDTETISEFSNLAITGATSLVTLICCFVYMGIISLFGLLISIFVIFIAAGLYFIIGKQANKLWEQTRDIQNIFFKFINDLISGFKELSLNNGKRIDFKRDMQESCNTYREKRIQGDLKFANVNVIGELLFTFVIGVVAFAFPVIFDNLKLNSLRTYVFIMLYMTGPVHGILGSIPSVFRVRISWNRINELSGQLDSIKDTQQKQASDKNNTGNLNIELRGVEYHYKNNEGEAFSVGPIEHRFKSGEITFITGGNGSGKSTLAKLITGLYSPDTGEIYINGEKTNSFELSQKYSAIFSDFHLFEKLYGIDHAVKNDEIENYLNILHIKDKVQINNGVLNTIKLSTGQRKRLALLISYLEDRPVYLFDEWAADQDPEFRKFFYNTLLPELKGRGKCIIAITHDDRFFDLADKVIKMDLGKIVN